MSECKFAVEAFHAYIESIGLSRPAGTLGELKAFKAGADWQRSLAQAELAAFKAQQSAPDTEALKAEIVSLTVRPMNNELLPCPFCGDDEIMDFQAHLENRVQCAMCNVSTDTFPSCEESHAAWNTRTKAAPTEVPYALRQWAMDDEPESTLFDQGYNAARGWVRIQLAAAPAQPQSDALKANMLREQWNNRPHAWGDAVAQPQSDAGIVDMYRHLQKVTPYRFKKIQDASITDGGDVMYFHKDRFDAALLADMADQLGLNRSKTT